MQNTIVENDIITDLQHIPDSEHTGQSKYDLQNESLLAVEITNLWSEHVRAQTSQRTTSKELRQIRAALAERLHSMKAVLCRPGCGGMWAGWLKNRNIPRSTADRLVSRYDELQNEAQHNMPTDPITPQEEVEQLEQSLLPRLRPVLTTNDMAYRFMCALAEGLHLNYTVGDNKLVVAQPSSHETFLSELSLGGAAGVRNGLSWGLIDLVFWEPPKLSAAVLGRGTAQQPTLDNNVVYIRQLTE